MLAAVAQVGPPLSVRWAYGSLSQIRTLRPEVLSPVTGTFSIVY